MSNKIKEKQEFHCEKCDFRTFKFSNYNVHLQTNKHKKMTQDNNQLEEKNVYICECGKKYKYRQGLWYHKQHCKKYNKEEITDKEINGDYIYILKNINAHLTNVIKEQDTIKELLKENSKTQKKILEHFLITA